MLRSALQNSFSSGKAQVRLRAEGYWKAVFVYQVLVDNATTVGIKHPQVEISAGFHSSAIS